MFDLDQLIADCRKNPEPAAVREVLGRMFSNPNEVLASLGEPTRADFNVLYSGPEVTVLNLVWGADMHVQPHDHRTWAVIGIYTGREDNIFWRRLPGNRVEAAGAKSLCRGDVYPMGKDIIHSVLNPLPRLTGAIHIYGGDFLQAPRSGWDAETLTEQPYDSEAVGRAFAEANRKAYAAS